MNTQVLAARAAAIAHPLFVNRGWTYGEATPPSQRQLEETIRRLLHNVEGIEQDGPGDHAFCATGRFRVQSDWFEDEPEPEVSVLLELGHSYDEGVEE